MGCRPTPFWTIFCVLVLGGCVGSSPEYYRTPDHWSKASAYGNGHSRAYAAEAEQNYTLSKTEPSQPADKGSALSPFAGSRTTNTPNPTQTPLFFGDSCLREMNRRGISYIALDSLKGVENPVEVRGSLGGVAYYAADGRSLRMDCRLAIALDQMGAVMRQSGVVRVRYSGAYVYRTTRSGRLSHHAHGLAIDLHEFEVRQEKLSVKANFQRKIGCPRSAPLLNALACQMRSEAVFDEFLTPDFNADHYDHLHISVPRKSSLGPL